jgi:hypothetical protein
MEIKFPILPNEIIREILLFRSYQSLYDKLKKLNLDEKVFIELLKGLSGFVFGSFVLSCLLDNDNFNDIDILCIKKDFINPDGKIIIFNNMIRNSIKSFGQKEIKNEEYSPRDICKTCAEFHGDTQLYEYTIKHHLETISFDIVASKNPIEHLKTNAFDLDNIHFDGKKFYIYNDIIKFICFPQFYIKSLRNGIDFEEIYNPECMKCYGYDFENETDINNHKQIDEILLEINDNQNENQNESHLLNNYENLQFRKLDSILYEIKKLITNKKILINQKIKLSWLNEESFKLNVIEFIKLVLSHYNPKKQEKITKYRIIRTFFRIIKNILRGFNCKNLNDYFDL